MKMSAFSFDYMKIEQISRTFPKFTYFENMSAQGVPLNILQVCCLLYSTSSEWIHVGGGGVGYSPMKSVLLSFRDWMTHNYTKCLFYTLTKVCMFDQHSCGFLYTMITWLNIANFAEFVFIEQICLKNK